MPTLLCRPAHLATLLGFTLSVSALVPPAPTVAQQTEADPAPLQLEDLTGPPDYWSARLAPDGRYLAVVRRDGRERLLVTVDLDSDELDTVSHEMGKHSISWIRWATSNRLLVYFDVTDKVAAVDRDGTNLMWLLDTGSAFGSRKYHNPRLVLTLPDDPDHILMSAWHDGGNSLFKVNISTGSEERIATGNKHTVAWFGDRAGDPAFRFDTNSRRSALYVFSREKRGGNGRIRWRKTHTLRRDRTAPERLVLEKFQPLWPGPTVSSYFVKALTEHADTIGIYLYDFESGEYLERIYTNASYDVAGAVFHPETREPLGFYYFEDKVVFEMQDSTIQVHLNDLSERFGNASIYPLQASSDRTRLLLLGTGPQDPGSYHVYDSKSRATHHIADTHGVIARRALASAKVVKYVARDGLALSGYLTRPVGAGDGAKPPLIVFPHGGPELRDTLSFHPLAQLFAASGYQVFQPNFRGSAGYGRSFAKLGHGQFGRAMQTDIDDGFAYLVDAGLADPDLACIVGTSYGGYAALAAATLTPDLYRCVVSQAGISDLVRMLRTVREKEGARSEPYKYWVKVIGHPRTDRARLEAVSPARLADRVTVPILLIHGYFDDIVPIEQSEIMQKSLSEAGKEVELMRLATGHHLVEQHLQPEVYEKILEFLQNHLPVEQ